MQPSARRMVTIVVTTALTPLFLISIGFLTYDPLQVFHPVWSREPSLHPNMRWQAAGLIRHHPFDSVILGTSMMENTSANKASKLLGGRFANLSLTASDYVERAIVLDHLLRYRPVSKVIYSLDSVYMNSRRGYPPFPIETFDFLYDKNPFNDIRVYLNQHFATCLLHWSSNQDCIGRPGASLDRPNAWFGEPEHAARFGGLANWCSAREYYQIKDAREALRKSIARMAGGTAPSQQEIKQKLAQAVAYTETNLLRIVREHPETRFQLIFPPYFRALFAIWHQSMPDNSAIHVAVLRHLAEASRTLPNLSVHAFETADFLDEIANYKDLAHYREDYDSVILAAIAADRFRLTLENIDNYIAESVARAKKFNLHALYDALEHCQ
jgi:hypothetical protein